MAILCNAVMRYDIDTRGIRGIDGRAKRKEIYNNQRSGEVRERSLIVVHSNDRTEYYALCRWRKERRNRR